jgi:hypothetical protein
MVIINNPNPYGCLSKIILRDFEIKNKINLPEDYRSFLLSNNGGQPNPSFFWIQPINDGSSVNNLFGLHNGPIHLSLETYIGGNYLKFPNLYLPFGDDGMGNFLCIVLTKDNFGEVVFLDHDLHDFQNLDSLIGISKIANSFSDFINSLIDPPEK